MRLCILLLGLLCILPLDRAKVALAETKPDFTQLDAVPLDGTEDAVVTAFEAIKATTATSSPAPKQTSSIGSGPCVGITCAIQRLNPDPQSAQQRYREQMTAISNRGLTPVQIRAQPFNRQDIVYCTYPRVKGSYETVDRTISTSDRAREVFAFFTELGPDRPCETNATKLLTEQHLAATTESELTIESEFRQAAIAKFGSPTFRAPSSTEPTLADPTMAWCDTGTVADCKTGGPSVNRRLTLILFSQNLTYPTRQETVGRFQLEDLQEERRVHAGISNSDVEHSKPQI